MKPGDIQVTIELCQNCGAEIYRDEVRGYESIKTLFIQCNCKKRKSAGDMKVLFLKGDKQ
jgi:hypothetical protein